MKFTWHGINKNFDKKAKKDNVFENEIWAKKQFIKLEKILHYKKKKKNNFDYSEYCLSVIAASLKKKKISILDYGGGVAEEYFKLKESLKNKKINFFLLETKQLIMLLKKKGLDKEINLLTKICDFEKKDIIHFGSSFHYIENWKLILKKCLKYKPEYLIFVDLLCGKIERTFSTNQLYYKKKIPIWVFKEDDIINFLQKNNYQIIYESNFSSEFFKKNKSKLMRNFPSNLRINCPKQLVFRAIKPYEKN